MKCKWVILVLVLSLPVFAQMPGHDGPPMGGPMGEHMAGMHAGGPGHMGEWWKNSELVQQLKLTDAQRKQIEQSFLDHRLRLIDENAEVQKQEIKLHSLMTADNFSETQAVSQLDQLLAARTKLAKDNAMMLITMRRVLTPEQWKTLESMHHRRGMAAGRGMGGGMGMGRGARRGPGGPPPASGQPGPPPPSSPQDE